MNVLLQRVPDDLHRTLKSLAALQGISLRALIIRILTNYVNGKAEGGDKP